MLYRELRRQCSTLSIRRMTEASTSQYSALSPVTAVTPIPRRIAKLDSQLVNIGSFRVILLERGSRLESDCMQARHTARCALRHSAKVKLMVTHRSRKRSGRLKSPPSQRERKAAMFTKTSVSSTSSPAIAGSGFQSTAVDERRVRETHSSRVWREELAEMLEANLRHLDALNQGIVPTHVQRTARS